MSDTLTSKQLSKVVSKPSEKRLLHVIYFQTTLKTSIQIPPL